MNDEEAGFLAHLQAAPEDETARLAYSDWLGDRGREADADCPDYQLRDTCTAAEIIEAAVEGFARLPLERQDELLNGYEWRDGVLVRVGAVAG